MRRWLRYDGVARLRRLMPALALALLMILALSLVPARAADAPPPPVPAPATAAAAPAMDNAMSSAGWLQQILIKLEAEAVDDVMMLPETPGALEREWRSFDSHGSALGALVNVFWIVVAAGIAWLVERGVARGLSRSLRRGMRLRPDGPTVVGLLLLLGCDVLAVATFGGIFIYGRHALAALGITTGLLLLAVNVLVRWRVVSVVIRAVLRPSEPVARLVEVSDREARHLARFMSATLLVVILLIGLGRVGLMDEDSGASHVLALVVALLVCGLYGLLVFRARAVAEALIRGPARGGVIGALRAAIARAWLGIALVLVAGLFVSFVFGLSLGLLSYYHGATSTLGILFVLLVVERLTERGWHDTYRSQGASQVDRLVAMSLQRILRAVVMMIAAVLLVWIWTDAIEMSDASAGKAMQSTLAAVLTLFAAYVIWELARLGIDRHLVDVSVGPRLPGSDAEDEAAPGSRLQTMLPMLRAGFGVVVAIIAALTVLSRLGIDTAPLIAGAGVFGLAISFGAQSLVRDIISGLFYIWDDAFRVGEYIDTGRLKGTVEALGIRSMKLRHHNGPLHTIPYGQLGSVTNQSRDFTTLKFNLRLEPGTDIELVRKTSKRIGLEMQQDSEIAAEVILPLKMQGIAEIADNAVVCRFKFTARPIKPSWIQREYLKRMYRVFAETGIRFATGTLTLQTLPPVLEPAVEPASSFLGEAPVPAPATRVA